MTERRDPNNVPLNEDFLDNLPDRQIAERNSVYKLANKHRGADGLATDSNMPDSQTDFGDSDYSSTPANTNDRNFGDSLHNTAGQKYNDPNYSGNITPAQTNNQSRYGSERGSQIPAGSGYPVNGGGNDKDVNLISEHDGPGFGVRHGSDAGDQLGYNPQVEQAWGKQENQLPETVSLNNQGYNGPSKLDNVNPDPASTRREQVGFRTNMIDGERDQEYSTQSNANPTFGTDSQAMSDVNSDPGYRPS